MGALEAKGKIRVARRELRRKVQQCRNEDYTQADQAAAGCSPSDTVAQCNSKLFSRCVRRERGKVDAETSAMVRTCNALIDKLKQDMARCFGWPGKMEGRAECPVFFFRGRSRAA